MKKIFAIISVIVLSLTACNQEDIIIDTVKNSNYYILTSKKQLIKYSIADRSSEMLYELPAPVTKIEHFRGNYFLLMPSIKTIYVIDDKMFKIIAKIDLNTVNLTPSDICFPNATDAYICSETNNLVSIIDLTTLKISNTQIPVGKFPVSIAGIGNQVYACCQNENAIFVIDTRRNAVVDTIDVATNPNLVKFSYDGAFAFVTSTGQNKTNGSKTSAVFQIIDIATRNIYKQFMLGTTSNIAKNIIPTGIAVSPKNLYVSSNKYLFRIAVPNGQSSIKISKNNYSTVKYNEAKEEFYMVNNMQSILVYNAKKHKRIATYKLDMDIESIMSK